MITLKQFLIYSFLLFLYATCEGQVAKPSYLQLMPELSKYVASFLKLEETNLALINAKVIDGTGTPAKTDQTILVQNGKILQIGASNLLAIPDGFRQIDLEGHTLIPGLIGMHNHMRLPSSAMFFTAPKLYLASGVTTIQTCGTGNPEEEIAIAQAIKEGREPGAEIINSGPYLTGPEGKSNFIRFTDEQMVRDTIRYWSERGVKWFKVYRNTRPQDLAIIIDEAHKHGAKVSGHLCATTYMEAANLGIDAIEHGFIHSYDHAEGKEAETCSGSRDFRSKLEINSPEIEKVHQALIKNNVALTSTLAIFDAQARGEANPLALELMAPTLLEAHEHRQQRRKELGEEWYFKKEWLKKSMQYDLAFYRSGGLLTAGLDPGHHNLPGIGDQKNYQLFIEAGFKPEEAIQVMTSNGAKLLERSDIGIIKAGKRANLVVLKGDLENDSAVIQQIVYLFKEGHAFDPEKLVAEVKGHVGSEIDDQMIYLGRKAPGLKPEILAPNFISNEEDYEFGCVFSKDAKEFFYAIDRGGRNEILCTKLDRGVWTMPEVIISHEVYGFNDPMLSPEEDKLYFISNLPLDTARKDIDIWYVERQGAGWSEPINAGNKINTTKDEYYISFSDEGRMYFASGRDVPEDRYWDFNIYYSDQVEGVFQDPVRLGENINTDRYEADVFVAPDESYMIFCAIRNDGLGQGDLYISFKMEDGTWGPSKNMGAPINDDFHQLCPFVSKDGKYFFYTSNKELYWIDAKILEGYRE